MSYSLMSQVSRLTSPISRPPAEGRSHISHLRLKSFPSKYTIISLVPFLPLRFQGFPIFEGSSKMGNDDGAAYEEGDAHAFNYFFL